MAVAVDFGRHPAPRERVIGAARTIADAELAIGALGPGSAGDDSIGDPIVVRRALDWIRNGGEKRVGSGSLEVLDGRPQILEAFAVEARPGAGADRTARA